MLVNTKNKYPLPLLLLLYLTQRERGGRYIQYTAVLQYIYLVFGCCLNIFLLFNLLSALCVFTEKVRNILHTAAADTQKVF